MYIKWIKNEHKNNNLIHKKYIINFLKKCLNSNKGKLKKIIINFWKKNLSLLKIIAKFKKDYLI